MNRLLFFTLSFLIIFIGQSFGEPVPWPIKPAKSFFKTDGGLAYVSTPEEFALMIKNATDSTSSFYLYILETDIVINEGDASTWAKHPPKYKWTAVGTKASPAKISQLDGNGHTISGLYVNSEDDFQGLFGYINGYVRNLKIVNSYIKGGNYVGAVAGVTDFDISDIAVEAIVEGLDYVGGVVGFPGYGSNETSVTRSTFKGSVKGVNYVGGIFGAGDVFYQFSGGASSCDNYGSVYGEKYVGGIVGSFDVDVPKSGSHFTKLRNFGTISGTAYVGGLAGLYHIDRDGSGTAKDYNISLLRNMGDVIGDMFVAGLIGEYGGGQGHYYFSVEDSYNAGRISSRSYGVSPFYNFNTGPSDRPNYCIRCVNFAEVYNNTNLIEEKIKSSDINNYVDSLGPNFLPDTGRVKINNGYPILLEEDPNYKYLEGEGFPDSPYLISSTKDLINFNKHSLANRYKDRTYYKQTADIEWDPSINWSPISANTIRYDGGNHKISNLYSHSANGCAAFLDSLDYSSHVKNLEFENVDIEGFNLAAAVLCSGSAQFSNLKISGKISANDSYAIAGSVVARTSSGNFLSNIVNTADIYALNDGIAGGIVGQSKTGYPSIYKAVNKGNVTAGFKAGGISAERGVILYAENYGDISASSLVGGIAGSAESIFNSFNRGKVTGVKTVGGIAGTVTLAHDVYNAGEVETEFKGNSGALFGEIEDYFGEIETWQANILRAYHLKNGLPLAGYFFDKIEIKDTASFTHKEFIDKETAKKMGAAFKADNDGINDGYPLLSHEFQGEGTPEKPFLITSKEELLRFNRLTNDTILYMHYSGQSYKLTKDITLDSNEIWTPISSVKYSSFTGNFDGDGHTISNLTFDAGKSSTMRSTKAAFIATATGATVKNLRIKDSDFKGDYAATFIAEAYSATLINCGNDNSNIYGYQFAGGLIARSDSSILIDRTYNTGLIEGIECVAGLVGSISISKPSYILNSYHRGKIRNNKRISNRFNEYFYLDYERSTLVYQNLYTTDSLDAYQCDSCTDINIFHMKWDEKDSTGLTAKKMKAREFAERLGEAFAYDSLGVNGGFPILSGKEVPLPIIVKDSSTIVKPKLEKKQPSGFTIAIQERTLMLQGDLAHKKVAVFDVKGSPVWSGRATMNSLSVPISKPGIYIVRCGNKARKAIIY